MKFSLGIASITVTDEEYNDHKNYFDKHVKFKGSEFIGWSKPENENEYVIVWFSGLKPLICILSGRLIRVGVIRNIS